MWSIPIPGINKTFIIHGVEDIPYGIIGNPNGVNRIKESTREKAKARKKKAKLHRKQGRH